MENLLVLLDKIQQVSPLPIFSKDVVIVQNAGMQHWLNMSLAKQRGISMNIDYALPSQFLWKLVRTIASEEDVPDQSPFSREVLAWRIFTLLANKEVMDDADFTTATRYWNTQTNTQISSESDSFSHRSFNTEFASEEDLKRYQLACQMADLFEQYLIFRPIWIDNWENGNFTAGFVKDEESDVADIAKWQGKLWYLLTREQSYNPINLIEQAINQLKEGRFDQQHLKNSLPKRISFFGINIMAPMWLSFVNELSEYVDVHFFHLNPCYSYWGDVITEKQAIKSIQKWVDGYNDITASVGNPLLANLGQQGREFMALLHGYSTINIDAFEDIHDSELTNFDDNNPSNTNGANSVNNISVLQQVQHDILTLSDARIEPVKKLDDSIVFTSAHSALREVQGLHDWLLHQFNNDSTLTPKDILVMCPQVEEYAPYVNAVFARGWQEFDDKVPPLPCSIADRVSKDSEPVVAAFSDLLTLPDSRFQVSQLLSFLRIPAMQTKFDLSVEDIDKISVWLDHASIHWGLDQQHKQHTLKSDAVTNSFTWQQGLSRLLRGFAYGDYETIYNDQLLLPSIEGNDGELLGQLMLILEQLQMYSLSMSKARTAEQWKKFLNELIVELFDTTNDDGFIIVDQAIESLIEYCMHAKFEEKIDLLIVRDFLNQHFSEPDPGRQFIVGQVTFCSMLPMRSIPFKVIAILGLNDGLFPRQRQPLSFDLMSVTPAMLGDRSRRGDDRYLFLEAIISARRSLYLSYQGKNIKNNSPKQASLVLKELMEYLELGYGWSLLNEENSSEIEEEYVKSEIHGKLRHLPMQPFSEKNYRGSLKSFDNHWLKLSQTFDHNATGNLSTETSVNKLANSLSEMLEQESDGTYVLNLELSKLISFFQHPSRSFAQSQLNLDLNIRALELDDVEPFEFDRLQSYLLREQLIKSYLPDISNTDEILSDEQRELVVEQTLKAAALSGKFPETIIRDKTFENWKQDTEQFSQIIQEHNALVQAHENCTISLILTTEELGVDLQTLSPEANISKNINVNISTRLPISDNKLAFYRSSTPKFKDFIILYLHQCILSLAKLQQTPDQLSLDTINATHGFYFDTKSQKVIQYKYAEIADAKAQLIKFICYFAKGSQQAVLVNGELAEKAFSAKVFEQEQFELFWDDPNAMMSIGNDPYVHYFWPTCPSIDEVLPELEYLYLDMFNAREQIK
ncbi:exodeoxyribonuclease V subunit gamma [Pseudocolwellia sp. HL-MZ19]|uniref:exodeoxyribonuclease V subunit gamma n=1 Tax=Pseudocolwellia sp. HL-MZ19 TaxID=3400846 RepID=UPI003CECF9DC